MSHKNFSISIVSHGHQKFVAPLLEDLALLRRGDFEVILTLNLPENLGVDCSALPFPVTLIRNPVPKTFAENHNAAFAASESDFFVILNPDIRLLGDPFGGMLDLLNENPNCLCAPLVVNKQGATEDSARDFPTPIFLVKKLFGKIFNVRVVGRFAPHENALSMPDWVAGMFIVIPRRIYDKLHGLDERYRMYYEDVDFCARAHLAGYQVVVNGHAKVIHEAQRDSHRKLAYMIWHVRSALRFFTSKVFRDVLLKRQSVSKWLA